MSRQKQYQLRSRRNGLIIPIPAHNQGVIPRFGIEDNQMIFAPANVGDREPSQMPIDTTTVKMGSADAPRVVPGPRSTLTVEDGATPAPVAAPRARKATKTAKAAAPVAAPEVAAPRARKAAKTAKAAATPPVKVDASPSEELA